MTCFDYDDHDEPADYDDEPVPPCEHRLKFWARTDDHTRTLTCSDCGERFTVIHTLGTPFAQAFALIDRSDQKEACGDPCKPDAHHPNYQHPLCVMWFCRSCHKGLHNAEL